MERRGHSYFCFHYASDGDSERYFMSSFLISQFMVFNKQNYNKKTIHLKYKSGKLLGRHHSIALNHP